MCERYERAEQLSSNADAKCQKNIHKLTETYFIHV